MINSIVKVHSGSAHVKGRARRYAYYIASLFIISQTKDGREIFINSGKYVGPYRSRAKAEHFGKDLACDKGAVFMNGYGSLHNREIEGFLPILDYQI